jgi:hypothetical protein
MLDENVITLTRGFRHIGPLTVSVGLCSIATTEQLVVASGKRIAAGIET